MITAVGGHAAHTGYAESDVVRGTNDGALFLLRRRVGWYYRQALQVVDIAGPPGWRVSEPRHRGRARLGHHQEGIRAQDPRGQFRRLNSHGR